MEYFVRDRRGDEYPCDSRDDAIADAARMDESEPSCAPHRAIERTVFERDITPERAS